MMPLEHRHPSLTNQALCAYGEAVAAKSAAGELKFLTHHKALKPAPKMRGFFMSERVGGASRGHARTLWRVTSTPMRSGTQAIEVAQVPGKPEHKESIMANITLNTSLDDEPRVRDLDIAERLGMERPRDIRQLISRNFAELRGYGSTRYRTAMITAGKGAKRKVREYYLNEGQALLICCLSRTEKAAEVRKLLIETYQAHRRGNTLPATSNTLPVIPTQAELFTIHQGWLIDLAQTSGRAGDMALMDHHKHGLVVAPLPGHVANGLGTMPQRTTQHMLPCSNSLRLDHSVVLGLAIRRVS